MSKSRGSEKEGGRGREAAGEGLPDSAPPANTFELALEQLEGTVARLEEGEMPLEEALALFESGVKLSRQCGVTLEEAERRIEILVADREGSEDPRTIPFESDEDSDSRQADEDLED